MVTNHPSFVLQDSQITFSLELLCYLVHSLGVTNKWTAEKDTLEKGQSTFSGLPKDTLSVRLTVIILSANQSVSTSQGIIMLILATDMARHSEILESFKSKIDNFDFTSEDHLNSVITVLLWLTCIGFLLDRRQWDPVCLHVQCILLERWRTYERPLTL